MHAVIIGIGGYDDVVVAQVFQVFLHAEGVDQEVEFLVFGHPLAAFLEAVDGLAPQGEDRLGVGIPHLGDGTGGGVSLRDEDGGLFPQVFHSLGEFVVTEVVSAVPELAVVNGRFLGPFAGLFLYAGNFFPFGLGGLDLILNGGDYVHMHMEIVVQVLGDKVVDVGADGGTAVYGRGAVRSFHLLFPHIGGPQLGFGLAFEDGLLDLDGNGAYDALADVLGLVILLEKVLEGFGDGFAVCSQVGAAVAGVLAVDEGGDVFPVAVAVGEHDLDVFPFQVDEGIQGRLAHILVHQVQQAVFALVGYSVEVERETFLEV